MIAASLTRLRAFLFFSSAIFTYPSLAMARRKKKPRLRVAKEARRRARLGIGLPPTERTIPNKRDKPTKHKETLGNLLNET